MAHYEVYPEGYIFDSTSIDDVIFYREGSVDRDLPNEVLDFVSDTSYDKTYSFWNVSMYGTPVTDATSNIVSTDIMQSTLSVPQSQFVYWLNPSEHFEKWNTMITRLWDMKKEVVIVANENAAARVQKFFRDYITKFRFHYHLIVGSGLYVMYLPEQRSVTCQEYIWDVKEFETEYSNIMNEFKDKQSDKTLMNTTDNVIPIVNHEIDGNKNSMIESLLVVGVKVTICDYLVAIPTSIEDLVDRCDKRQNRKVSSLSVSKLIEKNNKLVKHGAKLYQGLSNELRYHQDMVRSMPEGIYAKIKQQMTLPAPGADKYVARSAFKLLDIEDAFSLTKVARVCDAIPGCESRVLDLGSAPGSFCQVFDQKGIKVIDSISLSPDEDPKANEMLVRTNKQYLQYGGDILRIAAKVDECLPREYYDIVTCDASNFSGFKEILHEADHIPILYSAIKIGVHSLKLSGSLVIKLVGMANQQTRKLISYVADCFGKLHLCKPVGCRQTSSEFYLVASDFGGLMRVGPLKDYFHSDHDYCDPYAGSLGNAAIALYLAQIEALKVQAYLMWLENN